MRNLAYIIRVMDRGLYETYAVRGYVNRDLAHIDACKEARCEYNKVILTADDNGKPVLYATYVNGGYTTMYVPPDDEQKYAEMF